VLDLLTKEFVSRKSMICCPSRHQGDIDVVLGEKFIEQNDPLAVHLDIVLV
jgi:hypothetical protein